jgi:serine/threonine-protein kinase
MADSHLSRYPAAACRRVYDRAVPLAGGDVFAGYRIRRRLGSGAMGDVYLAEHPHLPRQDALKILPLDISGDLSARNLF